MRFLHTSDWHLGRIFHGLHLTEEQSSVLAQLVELAVNSKVDAVLIAGDIYDRAVPPTQAVTLLDETLSTLVKKHNIPVIMIAGNHDNPERLAFAQSLLAEGRLFIYGPVQKDARPVVLYDEFGPVYFAPLTYADPFTASNAAGLELTSHEAALRWQVESMLAQIPAAARKVALAHVFLTGSGESPDSERPLSIGGASTVGAENFAAFDYTALGHLHACQQGGDKIRYSGSLLKYSFNETDQTKGVHIVELDGEGNAAVETVVLKPTHELARLRGTFADLLENPRTELRNNYLQVVLDDGQPVLDAKYRLEQAYPHILHLEYARLQNAAGEITPGSHRRLGIKELFCSFFEQVNDRVLDEEEEKILDAVIEEASQAERSV